MKLSCASIMVGGIHLGGTKAITKMTVCVFPSSVGQQEEPLAGANNTVCTAQRLIKEGEEQEDGDGSCLELDDLFNYLGKILSPLTHASL